MNTFTRVWALLLCACSAVPLLAQTTILQESFETDGNGTRYTLTTAFDDGTNDHFGRTDGSNISQGVSGEDGSFFIAGEDLDDGGGDGNSFKTLEITGISISSFTDVTFLGLFAFSEGGWDPNSDVLYVEYSLDGGAFTKILQFAAEGTSGSFNNPVYLDTDFDGEGEIVASSLTNAMTEFSASIPSGNSLDIRIFVQANSASEEFAFDNIRIEGTSGGGNNAPTVDSPIADRTASVGDADVTINLDDVFGDLDSDPLTYTVDSNTDATVATASNASVNSELVIDFLAVGTTTVTVEADDGNGGTVSDSFDITVSNGYVAGDIIITEVMIRPSGGRDATGEYIELYNNTGSDIDLDGWTVSDNPGSSQDLFTISGPPPLIVPPGGVVVLAASNDPLGNGLYMPNYEFPRNSNPSIEGMALGNSGDEIYIDDPLGTRIFSLTYASSDVVQGKSIELSDLSTATDGVVTAGSDFAASTTLMSNGDFGTPGNIAPLPVRLVSFQAEAHRDGRYRVALRWASATESEFSHYEVERSADGRSFERIAQVEPQKPDTPGGLRTYAHFDEEPLRQTSYYRLRMVDTDGSVEHSPVRAVELPNYNGAKALRLGPNPARDRLSLRLGGLSPDEKVNVSLRTLEGGQVLERAFRASRGGSLEAEIKLSARLPEGLYLLEGSAKGLRFIRRIALRR